jgi:MFS family permease
MRQHDAYAVWRLPAFRRYFPGNMTLILGWQMQKVAIGWEIYERTHSAMALAYAGLVQFLPQVLFMLVAGHISDRHNRKRVLMAALTANAIAAVGLALNAAWGGSIYVLYACLFAYGSARAFIMPARAAFLPGIVPLDIFSSAVSWNTSGFEISSMA